MCFDMASLSSAGGSSYSKMAVIPFDEYMTLKLSSTMSPEEHKYQDVQRRFLHHDTLNIDDEQKQFLQAQDITEMRHWKQQQQQDSYPSHLKNVIPKVYQARAQKLYSHLVPHIKLSHAGELIDNKTGSVIPQSHIDDLLHHAVSDKPRQSVHIEGWQPFLHLLKEKNIPRMVLGRHTNEELLNLKKPEETTLSKSSSPPLHSVKRLATATTAKRHSISTPSITNRRDSTITTTPIPRGASSSSSTPLKSRLRQYPRKASASLKSPYKKF